MAKQVKISTSWEVKAGVLAITVESRGLEESKDAKPSGSFSRSVDLAAVFGTGYASLNEAGTGALEFGAFTALRNSTGSAETLAEAEVAIDRRLDAWGNGEWGAEREQSAVPFTANSVICLAVERATSGAQTAAFAADKLSALAEETCTANKMAAFAALEPADRAKIRKAVVDSIRKSKPAIAAAMLAIEDERAEAARKRRLAAAEKAAAAAAAAGGEAIGL